MRPDWSFERDKGGDGWFFCEAEPVLPGAGCWARCAGQVLRPALGDAPVALTAALFPQRCSVAVGEEIAIWIGYIFLPFAYVISNTP